MNKLFDCIVIGAGPAGVAASTYLKLANKSVLLIEKEKIGGKLNSLSKIANFPFSLSGEGKVLATSLENKVKEVDVETTFAEVRNISKQNDEFAVSTSEETYSSKFVILATGLPKSGYGYKGESTYLGKGVSYCATCDGFFFKNKVVAVVGNPSFVVEPALYLSGLASKVYVVSKDKLSDKDLDKFNNHSNIELIYSSLKEIKGEITVKSIVLEDKEIELNGVFLFDKEDPKDEIYKSLNLDLNPTNGTIKVSTINESSLCNCFAIGDCVDKSLRQILNASSDGMNAAVEIIKRLNK